jgi:arylsulfatase A-like enzyme
VPREKPFCLSMSFKAPHEQDEDPRAYLPSPSTLPLYTDTPIPTPKGAGRKDVRRFPLAIQRSESRRRWVTRFSTPELYQASMKGYYRLVSGIDGALGAIREALAARGLADNTIIIYSADHGVFNGEHGFAGKWYAHEESIRIPLIVFDPRLPANLRGTRRGATTLNIDLQPTILEMAGITPPASTHGRSLGGLIRGDGSRAREVFFIEHYLYYDAAHTKRHEWIPSSEGIRTQRWKYIRYVDDAAPYEELYDLANDRYETQNLAGQARFASQQRTLAGYWQKWRDSLHRPGGLWREPINGDDLRRDGLV